MRHNLPATTGASLLAYVTVEVAILSVFVRCKPSVSETWTWRLSVEDRFVRTYGRCNADTIRSSEFESYRIFMAYDSCFTTIA